MPSYVRWFGDIRLSDLPLVGGKNASLGELYSELTEQGLRVPNGFAITADAYSALITANGLEAAIRSILGALDVRNVSALASAGAAIRSLIEAADPPVGLADEIVTAYRRLGAEYGTTDLVVAVRSSATAEDLPGASFAGQQETYLGVRGDDAVLAACRRCFASLFTDRAISYRVDQGFDHLAVRLSIAVQKMVRADRGAAGVMFTLDPETGFRDVVLIDAAYGLGQAVVSGQLDPDEFWVFKPTFRQGLRTVLRRVLGRKSWRLVIGADGRPQRVDVPADEQGRFSLTDDEVLELARDGLAVERHYAAKYERPVPMDVEWAKDGEDGKLYVLQARPETVHSAAVSAAEVFTLGPRRGLERLVSGKAIGQKIGVGPARRMSDPGDLVKFQAGEVLVAAMTDPDWEPIMKLAAAIVTDRGGRTCHAAIVSRELGVPCLVGTERGTAVIGDGQVVTVSCAEGETGFVYRGAVPFARREVDLAGLAPPATPVMLNVGNPDEAFRLAALPAAGVGLARIEFIIASEIRVHPMALVAPDRVSDPATRAEIARLTRGYPDPAEYFVERLAEGVARIAAAFYPREVIVRLSDFKSNEYAGLLGGRDFEPEEENPMLGFRGAFRYCHPRYRDGFALECRAMKRVREEMGLTNVKLMIPFCRTIDEGRGVLDLMACLGLRRGEHGLEVYVMCEIPSNVILVADFAKLFDGFSIGSNDLTQLILGVDRDSEVVAPVFDERNPAVLAMVSEVIEGARAAGRKIGICGQAPSDYPEFTRFLVSRGITSISLNADAFVRGLETVRQAEQEEAGALIE